MTLFLMLPALFLAAQSAEPFDADSGWGIYSDTRQYPHSLPPSAGGGFDRDAGGGVYSDTRADRRHYAFAAALDADSGGGVYSDTSVWDGADSGDGVYSDTNVWDDPAGTEDYGYPDYWGGDVGSGEDGEDLSSGGGEGLSSGEDGLWSLFDDAEDSEGVESAPVLDSPSGGTSGEKKFEWWGHLNASGGITFQMFPEGSTSPFATMSNTLGFTARPFDDMAIKGSFYTEFPAFDFNLTSLYFDYIMNDMLYITVGKTGTGWGNSRIFDTNILDDEGDGTVVNPYTDETDTGRRFDAILTLPIGKGEIQGVGMYAIGEDISRSNLSLAAKIQYPIGPVSLELFGRKWATSDKYWMQPAVGMGLSTDIFGNHVNLWGMTHFSPDDPRELGIMRFVGGTSRTVDVDGYGKFGFAAEYQMTYDPDKDSDKVTHDIGLTVGWSHALGTDFSPAVRWWYNPISRQGYLLPTLTYTGLRHMDITLTVPYIFGGATYTNGKSSWSSTKDDPLLLFGLIFSLSVSY